jgi:hypothetical protein
MVLRQAGDLVVGLNRLAGDRTVAAASNREQALARPDQIDTQ